MREELGFKEGGGGGIGGGVHSTGNEQIRIRPVEKTLKVESEMWKAMKRENGLCQKKSI